MASTHTTRNHHIAQLRSAITALLKAQELWNSLRNDWDGGISTWLIDASSSDPDAIDYEGHDFTPNHEGLIKADIGDAYTSLTSIGTTINTHITNLVKLRKYT